MRHQGLGRVALREKTIDAAKKAPTGIGRHSPVSRVGCVGSEFDSRQRAAPARRARCDSRYTLSCVMPSGL